METTPLIQELSRRRIKTSNWVNVFEISGDQCAFHPSTTTTPRKVNRLSVCSGGIQVGVVKAFFHSGPEIYEYAWDIMSMASISKGLMPVKTIQTGVGKFTIDNTVADILYALLALGISAGNQAINRRALIIEGVSLGAIRALSLETYFDNNGLPNIVSSDAAIKVLEHIGSRNW